MSYCVVQRTMVGPRLSPGRLSTCETNAGLHESFPGPLCAKSAGVLVGIFWKGREIFPLLSRVPSKHETAACAL